MCETPHFHSLRENDKVVCCCCCRIRKQKLTKSCLGMILSMYVTTMCMHCLNCVSNCSIYFKFDQGKQNLNALCSFVLFLFSIPLSAYGQGHKPAMNM